jgi:hypothetical protein
MFGVLIRESRPAEVAERQSVSQLGGESGKPTLTCLAEQVIASLPDAQLFDDGNLDRIRKAAQLATLGEALLLCGPERRRRFLGRIKRHAW